MDTGSVVIVDALLKTGTLEEKGSLNERPLVSQQSSGGKCVNLYIRNHLREAPPPECWRLRSEDRIW
jgi:hypothetical protein